MGLAVYLINYEDDKCENCGHVIKKRGEEVFNANITHNLTVMAKELDIYKELWRPEELGITEAWQLILPLSFAVRDMEGNKDHYETFNSPNGWGTYENFLPWIKEYLSACIEYPVSSIEVSR